MDTDDSHNGTDKTPSRAPRDPRGRFVRSLDIAQRDALACDLKVQGLSFREIGERLGLSVAGAKSAVDRALARTIQPAADELRELELRRLDEITRVCWEALTSTNYVVSHGQVVRLDGRPLEDFGPRLQAASVLIRLSARRARLTGLDAAPAPNIYTMLSAVDAEIERLKAEAAQQAEADQPGVRRIIAEIEEPDDG